MSAPSTSGLSVELLLPVIDVKYGYFTLIAGKDIAERLAIAKRKPSGQSLTFWS